MTIEEGKQNMTVGQMGSIKLSELAAIVENTLGARFNKTSFWVLAEVSNHQFRQLRNYHSFDLVEKKINEDGLVARFSAKAWGSGAARIKEFERKTGQQFTSNIEVLAKVNVVFHRQYGLSLDVIDLDPAYTIGKLYESRQLTLLKLVNENSFIEKTADGYWTHNKSVPFALVVQRLAIISSLNSAGMEDFLHTIEKNPEGYQFEIDKYLVAVQGIGNADQIVQQLIQIFNSGKTYDAVLILRGGGAQTDFLLFDHYMIARAVAKFPIPIITGIGHQKNETIVDLMAHTATKTPTQAAEFILHHNRNFEQRIKNFEKVIAIYGKSMLPTHRQCLNEIQNRIVYRTRSVLSLNEKSLHQLQSMIDIEGTNALLRQSLQIRQIRKELLASVNARINGSRSDLIRQRDKLLTWPDILIRNAGQSLKYLNKSIELMSPERILEKGYALIKVNGQIRSSLRDLNIGQIVDIVTSQDTFEATINRKINHKNGRELNL